MPKAVAKYVVSDIDRTLVLSSSSEEHALSKPLIKRISQSHVIAFLLCTHRMVKSSLLPDSAYNNLSFFTHITRCQNSNTKKPWKEKQTIAHIKRNAEALTGKACLAVSTPEDLLSSCGKNFHFLENLELNFIYSDSGYPYVEITDYLHHDDNEPYLLERNGAKISLAVIKRHIDRFLTQENQLYMRLENAIFLGHIPNIESMVSRLECNYQLPSTIHPHTVPLEHCFSAPSMSRENPLMQAGKNQQFLQIAQYLSNRHTSEEIILIDIYDDSEESVLNYLYLFATNELPNNVIFRIYQYDYHHDANPFKPNRLLFNPAFIDQEKLELYEALFKAEIANNEDAYYLEQDHQGHYIKPLLRDELDHIIGISQPQVSQVLIDLAFEINQTLIPLNSEYLNYTENKSKEENQNHTIVDELFYRKYKKLLEITLTEKVKTMINQSLLSTDSPVLDFIIKLLPHTLPFRKGILELRELWEKIEFKNNHLSYQDIITPTMQKKLMEKYQQLLTDLIYFPTNFKKIEEQISHFKEIIHKIINCQKQLTHHLGAVDWRAVTHNNKFFTVLYGYSQNTINQLINNNSLPQQFDDIIFLGGEILRIQKFLKAADYFFLPLLNRVKFTIVNVILHNSPVSHIELQKLLVNLIKRSLHCVCNFVDLDVKVNITALSHLWINKPISLREYIKKMIVWDYSKAEKLLTAIDNKDQAAFVEALELRRNSACGILPTLGKEIYARVLNQNQKLKDLRASPLAEPFIKNDEIELQIKK
ncbi:MAG: hypothetical protein KIT27_06540 [Legionellales bacterium]|nr:hypothetical protein [Legionellales bacterium]